MPLPKGLDMTRYPSVAESDLNEIAITLSKSISVPCVICLWGDLGAGKTTFSRAFIQAVAPLTTDVPSPTFTIIQEYTTPRGELWHCDLYRLKSEYDAEELGLLDAFYDKICLIEWPERLGNYLPQKRIDIRIGINPDNTRQVEVITSKIDQTL